MSHINSFLFILYMVVILSMSYFAVKHLFNALFRPKRISLRIVTKEEQERHLRALKKDDR